MREIKFRCWDKTARKMRQVIEIVFNAGMYYDPNDNTVKLIWVKGHDIIDNKDIALKREQKNEYILMQYTGIKDRNRKEIYEGDIVKAENIDLAQIIYDEDRMAWGIKPINDFYFDSPLLADNANLELQVIGNKYENPELLEDK